MTTINSKYVGFDALLASNYLRTHRAALGFIGEEQEAKEVAHDALLKAKRAAVNYDATRPFYPWLYRIIKNTALDAIARRKNRAIGGLEDEKVACHGRSAESDVAVAQTTEMLRLAMCELSEEHQEVINLRHFQELSYAEIAGLLELEQGTVMSRLYRARKALSEAVNRLSGGI